MTRRQGLAGLLGLLLLVKAPRRRDTRHRSTPAGRGRIRDNFWASSCQWPQHRRPFGLPGLGLGFEQHALLDQRLDVPRVLGEQLLDQRRGLVELLAVLGALAAQCRGQLQLGSQDALLAGLVLEARILDRLGEDPAQDGLGLLACTQRQQALAGPLERFVGLPGLALGKSGEERPVGCCIRLRDAVSFLLSSLSSSRFEQLAELEVELGAAGSAAGLLERLHGGDRRLDLAGVDLGKQLGLHRAAPKDAPVCDGLGLVDGVEQREGLVGLAGLGEGDGEVGGVADQARVGRARAAAACRAFERPVEQVDRQLAPRRPPSPCRRGGRACGSWPSGPRPAGSGPRSTWATARAPRRTRRSPGRTGRGPGRSGPGSSGRRPPARDRARSRPCTWPGRSAAPGR